MAQTTETHPYFTRQARAFFAKAGGDPDRSGPLAAWAQEAREREDSTHGVLVAEDGTLVATTVWIRPDRDSATYVVEELLLPTDLLTPGNRIPDLRYPGFAEAFGQRVVEVRYWDVCTGGSKRIPEV